VSQRTRARTTGAAAKPTNRAEPAEQPQQSDDLIAAERGGGEQPVAAATDAPRRGKRAVAPSAPPSSPSGSPAASLPLQPEALARALRAVATELDRDPALAQRVAQAINDTPAAAASAALPAPPQAASANEPAPPTIGRSFRPSIVTGVAETLGPGVPDPFALRERLGEPGLREALASLRLGSLRAIVRQHKLDPAGGLSKLNDAEKLRAHILAATRKGRG
jgi:hypothetical protein